MSPRHSPTLSCTYRVWVQLSKHTAERWTVELVTDSMEDAEMVAARCARRNAVAGVQVIGSILGRLIYAKVVKP